MTLPRITGPINNPRPVIESGSKTVWVQTAAPTGWTKETADNDKALRVVSGTASTGGTDAFSTTFSAAKTTEGHALTEAELRAHTHTIPRASGGLGANWGLSQQATAGGTQASGSTGSSSAHSHDMTMDLQYVDVIIATKD